MMFNKISNYNRQVKSFSGSSAERTKEKEMLEKLSRIEESYVDAAIKNAGRSKSGTQQREFYG
jgi:hypothetical protein